NDNSTISKDVALQLPSGPNAGLILEVHYYNPTGSAQKDASGIRFCTGKKSARPHTATVHTLGSEAICIQPGAQQTVTGMCSPRTDMGDAHITGIWPHMHKIARRQTVIIHRSDGSSETIHDEPFSFNSQIFYPKDNVVVHPGDTVETRCGYQNDTSSEVHYGERTQDEMCYAFVLAWPAGSLANASTPGLDTSTFSLNRCAEPLSILESCNGLADAPVNVQ
ncbi:MAG TPA: hypothetical protein VG963_05435, partial [Polyangiaceae bacterium]|nr:hypothetical protein [Polyangiaceae bacterium]